MPRGLPDGTLWGKGNLLASLHALANALSMLGGRSIFFGRGEPVVLIEFDKGLAGWNSLWDGGGGGVGLDGRTAYLGHLSVRLLTGDETGDWAHIERSFSYPVTGKVGFEFSFAGDTQDSKIELKVRLYYEHKIWRFGVRYSFGSCILYYLEPDDTWTVLSDPVYLFNDQGTFHTLKMILDLDTYSYHLLKLDETAYVLTQKQTHVSGAIYPRIVSAEMTATAEEDANIAVYVDAFLMTQGEI